MIRQIERPNPLERVSGTHHKEAITVAVNQLVPMYRDSDARMMIMATDGLPQDVRGNEFTGAQNPCLFQANNLSFAIVEEDIEFYVVATEGFELINSQPFQCLMQGSINNIIVENRTLYLDEQSEDIQSTIYYEYCFPWEDLCPNPLYPSFNYTNVPLRANRLLNITLEFETLFYTFTISGEDRYDVAEVKIVAYASNCPVGNGWTFQSKVFEWTEDRTSVKSFLSD